MTIRVAHLYPEYLNIYADRGNIAVLSNRARWRGLGFEVEAVSLGEPVSSRNASSILNGSTMGV